jgi:predicted RND superfamily exporter protein
MNAAVAALERFVLDRSRLLLVLIIAVCVGTGLFATQVRLDASGDSLLLERDPDLRVYRGLRARYGSDDYLVVTFAPEEDLFGDASLERLATLRDKLEALPAIASVTTLLDVPLVASPPLPLDELAKGAPTILSPGTDRELAREELTNGPLYSDLLVGEGGRTTALLLNLQRDAAYDALLAARDDLRQKELTAPLTMAERDELLALNADIRVARERAADAQSDGIEQVRAILADYRDGERILLGGVPMIVKDMLDFIVGDIFTFGIGILAFLVVLLATIFARPRWVVVAMLACLLSAGFVSGLLGILDWPVSVVSANFVALLLIFSLSLTVHLIVRHQEFHREDPAASQRVLLSRTLRDKFTPSLFTSLTTAAAFASLTVSGIRPVIDFGWMMVIGMGVVLIIGLTLFPAALMQLSASTPQPRRRITAKITDFFARQVAQRPRAILLAFLICAVLSAVGLTRLQVENRFINNFKSNTEIYRSLVKIDQDLGGTMPLDVIIDADPAFFARALPEKGGESGFVEEPELEDSFGDDEFSGEAELEDSFGDDEFDDAGLEDDFGDDLDAESESNQVADLGSTSYWYNTFRLQQVKEVHEYLDSLPEVGKVLSMATTTDVFAATNDGKPLDTFFLSVLYKRAPPLVKSTLFDPYLSSDGNQVRLSARIFESDPNLRRAELLERIRTHLVDEMGFKPEQVRLSGLLVLYNNVLQSLYRSQILTLGFVFLAILAMFAVLFRSVSVALIGLAPNLLAAAAVLGLMGLLGIPLDIMTITIAAITVGIGVDDSIHYLHRFIAEHREHGDYDRAVQRAHAGIGSAMYYTSIVIAAGFSILALSNFIPIIYFGLLTGFAMLFAMVANLTLLPLLLVWLKPLGRGAVSAGSVA